VLLFQRSAAEVLSQAGKWFDDGEIYDWFAANLHRIHEPSMRSYVRARELKAAGMDSTLWPSRTRIGEPGSSPSYWPAMATAGPPGSRHSSSKAADAGRRSSTTGESWGAGTDVVESVVNWSRISAARLAEMVSKMVEHGWPFDKVG
jgi:hypothetical protein